MTPAQAKPIGIAAAVRINNEPVAMACNCADCKPPHLWLRYRIRNAIYDFIGTLYRKHAYRHVQRLLHKFNLHYAPPMPTIEGDRLNLLPARLIYNTNGSVGGSEGANPTKISVAQTHTGQQTNSFILAVPDPVALGAPDVQPYFFRIGGQPSP